VTKIRFNNSDHRFSDALHQEVKAYFDRTGQLQTGDYRLYLKSVVLLGGSLSLYLALLSLEMPVGLSLLCCVVMGFLWASIGFNIMHDACHGSYSQSKRLNYIMGLTMNGLGSNAFIWKQKHNIIHHTYTNIDGVDDDIAKSPVLRHCYSQPYKSFHRYQHIYMVLLYALSSVLWALVTDFEKYFRKSVNGTPLQHFNLQEHVIFWATKVLYVVFYVAIPVYFVGWGPWAVGYFVANAAMGLTMALVFQLAHVVEGTEFVDAQHAGEKLHIDDAWALHQLKTTSNFSMNSAIISWFVGGLNFQIEHHLFPKVSHIHYPEISKIVQRLSREYGYPYHVIPRLDTAIASHFRTMRMFGASPQAPVAA
jgi:linoleoyl-CoA desaturase